MNMRLNSRKNFLIVVDNAVFGMSIVLSIQTRDIGDRSRVV